MKRSLLSKVKNVLLNKYRKQIHLKAPTIQVVNKNVSFESYAKCLLLQLCHLFAGDTIWHCSARV